MFVMRTSVQDNVVDHIALVFGVIEAEGAAQVFRDVSRRTVVVAGLHVNGEGVPATQIEEVSIHTLPDEDNM